MKLLALLKRLIEGPKKWEDLTDAERQKMMSKSSRNQRILRILPKYKRKDIGPYIAGEGTYFNTEKREQYIGSEDSAMARGLAEERQAIIRESQRPRRD